MSRWFLPVLALLSAATPLVVDSALKGAALMSAALVGALLLSGASAAARHLVWLIGVLALLAVPLLSLVLPGWRVLPAWAVPPSMEASPLPEKDMSDGLHRTTLLRPAASEGAPLLADVPVRSPDTPATAAIPAIPAAVPTVAAGPVFLPQPVVWWRTALPSVWSAGCAVLLLRLLGAHWLLRRAARRARAVSDGPLTAALAAAALRLGVTQRVRLLVEEKRTIPVVWGVWRPRLMLPVEALTWDAGQLQSVLLHELAHIRRRDTLVQWVTQLACAVHWFNPLVWLAAWRLHVERERACDDMVLASGVKASAYAEHLLHIASQLSPARWTSACGLAMARKSALEGRLLAVLSGKLNRRGVTAALAASSLILGAGVAIPVAMLRAAGPENKPDAASAASQTPPPMQNRTGKIQAATLANLKWGEPVNGLRMALAFPPALKDPLLGEEEFYQLVVQNVSEKEIRYTADADAPNPRSMQWREGERIVQALSDRDAQKADWTLAPGECGVLWMFTKEERTKDGKTISSLLDKDLGGGTRYHVVVNMEVAKAPEGAWTGKLITGETRGSSDKADAPEPKHKDARALYEIWQRHARLSGDIPGALIGELAAAVKQFIKHNPSWRTVPKLDEILPRLDATHEWKPADAIALLDEVAGVQDSPLQTAAEKSTSATIRQGKALPEKFVDVAWGETQPNGLRAAWVLEPGAAGHRMGTALMARRLVQNTGKLPVMVRVPTWHQGDVSARDATGAEVEVSGFEWTTIPRLIPVRLAPGEFIEIDTPGVGLGKDAGRGRWAGPRVGSNVLAQDDTELTLTHGPLALDGSGVGMREDAPHIIGPGWWQAHIKAHLALELPLPASGAKRTHLLDRAVRELFDTTPTADEIDAFATDQTDGAFDALVQRLANRADVVEFSGSLPTAPVKFRVLPADPAADNTPRVVLGPGEYPLSAGTAEYGAVTLKIVGKPVGDRRTNDAQLLFEPTEFTGILKPDPHKLDLPDGWGTWAIVCRPGEGLFYLLHKGVVRKIDYTKPREITDTSANDLPAEFRDEVKRQFDIAGVSPESQAEVFEKPTPPATTPEPNSAESGPRADVKPVSKMLFNEDYAAMAVQSEKDVNFVLFYQGHLSSGISEWSSGAKWRFNGTVYLVDAAKTAVAGKNVNKRAISAQYTSDEPEKLYLDGKAYDLAAPRHAAGEKAPQMLGRVFILRDVGEPIQTDRTLALRDQKDLAAIGDFAAQYRVVAEALRTANAPGRYVLGDDVHLQITQTTVNPIRPGDFVPFLQDQAKIIFPDAKPEAARGPKPHEIALPNGSGTYGIVWERGGGTLWVQQKDLVRKYDFADPWKVQETRFAEGGITNIPMHLREAMKKAFDVSGAPVQKQMPEKPNGAAVPKLPMLPDDAYAKSGVHCQKFREEDAKRPGGELMGEVMEPSRPGDRDKELLVLGVRAAIDAQWRIGGAARVGLVVRNRSDGDVKFSYTGRLDNGISIVAVDEAGKEHGAATAQFDGLLTFQEMLLPAAHVATIKQFTIRFDAEKRGVSEPSVAAFHLPPGKYKLRCEWNDAHPDVAHEGEWTGELVNDELEFTVAAAPSGDAPKTSDAGPRRKVDWSKPPADSFFEGKYDPELLARLAGNPGTLKDDNNVWPLSEQILRAAVEGDPQFRHLLTDEKLAAADEDSRSLTMSLAAYDYSVFGNKAALKVILDQLEHGQHEAYLAAFPLGFVDEWDQSLAAVERVFAQRDGAKGEEYHRFWAHREWFFPESFAAFQKTQIAANKLDSASLQGVWKGSKEGVDVTLRFGKSQDWEVRFLETDRKSALSTEPSYTATRLYLMAANEKGTPVHCGTLRRGSDGVLLLHVLEHGAIRGDLGYRRVTDLVLTREADAPKGADAGQRRKVDELLQLAPESYARHFAKELAAAGIDAASLRGIWKGSGEGINVEIRFGERNEWEISRNGKSISRARLRIHSRAAEGDGIVEVHTLDETQSDAPYSYSWLKPRGTGKLRLHLYRQEASATPTVTEVDLTNQPGESGVPENPETAAAKVAPDALLGTWRGTVNGEKLMLSFHRPPAEKDVQLDIYFGEATIGALAGFTIAEDGGSVDVVQRSAGGGMKFGTLNPVEAGKLKLELYGRQTGQQETILTRDAEAAATEPQQEEARALFEFWRRQADDVEDGAIPYWLVDGLADEVRAFVHAHPNLDSSAKLEALLPRFATSVYQSLPLADAMQLLNDVAYYSTKPMEAYLAREQRLEKLTGSWEGKVNGRAALLRIGRRSPVANGISMELCFPTEGEFETLQYGAALDGIAFKLGLEQADGKPKPFGSLVPVRGESLKLTLLGKEEVFMLTRKVEPQPTEPREQAARELFEMWKATANADGTIPGTFIGNLATEVRAFGKAHAGRRHADNMVKLLPRFVTSRDWTQAEAIKLLDDVAYFATDPIVARLAKAKLVSGPLWRTMVEFQDIPVAIEKWSEPLRGLRIGLRIVEADWSIGGKVRAELWLHNAGEKDEIIQTTGPDRQDAGVIVSAIGADGIEHAAHRGSWRILTQPMVCMLPAGSVVMAKAFEVKFFGPENNAAVWSGPEFHGLPAGRYKLRCSWSDAAGLYEGKEWRGSITAPELEFTLVAGPAVDHPKVCPSGEWSAAWRELSATVAAARGTPDADVESLIAWGDTKDGLRSGVLMTDRVKRGGRTEARLVVRNVSEKSVTVALSPVPNRIDVEAAAADGTRLQVHKVWLLGVDPFFSYTFKPGEQLEFPAPPIQFGVERDADGKVRTPGFPICGVETGPGTVSVRFSMTNGHAPDSGVVKVVVEEGNKK